jgi:hydrogenase maturation factor
MKKLSAGKIPIEILNSTVLKMTGARSEMTVTPPKAGLDFAVVKVGRRFMVVSADPITGVTRDIGRYAVNVSANDVATSGNRPQFAESVVLMPEGSTETDIRRLAQQIHIAAKESGIAIVGGHTEVTPGLARPIVATTVFSFVEKFVTSADAKEGDSIMMTKTAGVEGTSELASMRGLLPEIPPSTLRRARNFISQVSVIDEAVAAFQTGWVHAMHDCTEGGLLGAVFEMSVASGLGFSVKEGAIPIAPETGQICRALSINPLRLIGSGSLLLAVEPGMEVKLTKVLKPFCRTTPIGKFQKGGKLLISNNGKKRLIRNAPEDELWRVIPSTPRSGHGP